MDKTWTKSGQTVPASDKRTEKDVFLHETNGV